MFYSILLGAITVPSILLVIGLFRLPAYANVFLTIPGFLLGWLFAVLFWMIIGFPIWGICEEWAFLRPLISSPINFCLMAFVATFLGAWIFADGWEYPFLFAGIAAVSAVVIWSLEKYFTRRLNEDPIKNQKEIRL